MRVEALVNLDGDCADYNASTARILARSVPPGRSVIARLYSSDRAMQTKVGATVPNLGANSKIAWISSNPLPYPLPLNFKALGTGANR